MERLKNSNRDQSASETESIPTVTKPLVDVVAAFTFSRLPRAERIARTIRDICVDDLKGSESTEIFIRLTPGNMEYLLQFAEKLEPYARKDFAVRYGHLEDGNAKT